MGGASGLGDGARVVIVGGGISGAAMAAALLFTARSRGRTVDVRVFEGCRGELEHHRSPVILSPECRSRLSALGCRVPPEWRSVELSGIEVISGRNRTLLSGPAGGLWVVDAWPDGLAGRTILSRALASVAELHGARFISRRVDRVEPAGRRLGDPAPQTGPGGIVVWSSGASERAHATVLACGAGAPIAHRFFEGFSGAPTVRAAHARLRCAPLQQPWSVARLMLSPLPGIDALYLIPCRSSVYALALGESVQPADLCQALMVAARDGHLADGFEIAHLSSTQVSAGPGKHLCAPGQLAVGPAAVGHVFQWTISEALASCSRAAVALVDGADDKALLERRYVGEGIFDLAEDARAATLAMKWLVRAGDRAATAMARAQERAPDFVSTGILGLPSPSPVALLAHARRAWIREVFGGIWRSATQPVPMAVPIVERDLYYVVDDDPEVRDSLTELLESRGAEVVAFADELALFCAVARRPPRAVLLDVVLSWVDGLRLCEGLKRDPLTRNTRVVVMSGLNHPFVSERALEAGAEAFLPKPITPERLFHVLQANELDVRRTPAPAGASFAESGVHAS